MKIAHFHVMTKHHNRGDMAIVDAVQEILRDALPTSEISDIDILELSYSGNLFMALSQIVRSDLIVIGGGGILSGFFFPIRRIVLKALKLFNKKVVLFGAGFAQNTASGEMDALVMAQITALYNMARVRSVRDEWSLDMLKQQGVESIICCGDPVLFFNPVRPGQAPAGTALKKIGFNFAYHGWNGQDTHLPKILHLYEQVMNRYSDQGYEIYYIVHHDFEIDMAEKLRKRIDFKICIEPSDALIERYRSLDLFVGMMLHSSIFALNAEIPVLNIAYDSKNLAFLKMFGLEQYCLAVENVTAEAVFEKLETLSSDWASSIGRIRKRKSEMKDGLNRLVCDITAPYGGISKHFLGP